MATSNLTTFSAKDAKAHFGELLDTALGRPVGITKHERLTAYVVSKNDFESMVERMQFLEDQLWLLQANSAREEGFVSPKTTDALMSKIRTLNNEEVENNKKRK